MESLVKTRGNIKAKLTRFRTYIEKIYGELQNQNTNLHDRRAIELEDRLSQISNVLAEFVEVHDQIDLISDKPDDEMKEIEQFENSYYYSISLAKEVLKTRPQNHIQNLTNDLGSPLASASNRQTPPFDKNSVQLPVVNIPRFSGDIEDFLEYREVFNNLVHENESITTIQKFHYLRASLAGTAAQIIKSLEFRSDNYQIAWETICDRYNNSRMLTYNHIKSLFNMESLQKESSVKLRHLHDMLFKHVNCLKSLVDTETLLETIIIYVVATKLDATTSREWESFKNNTSEIPSLNEFKTFLKNTANLLETLELKQIKPTAEKPKLRTKAFVSKNPCCSVCRKPHLIYSCDQFLKLSMRDRINKVKELKLCNNCLSRGHMVAQCKSRFTCKDCRSKHHSLIHEEPLTDISQSVAAVFPNQPGLSNQSLNATNNASVTAFCSESMHVLLPTASAQVYDVTGKAHTVRVLLDSGSQSNFISDRLCRLLKIPLKSVDMTVTGLNKAASQIRAVCEVQLQSHDCSFQTTISCLVMNKITSTLPSFYVNLDSFNIPDDILLSDPRFNQPGEIDLLLGSSVFWNILSQGQIRLGPDLPILQKTRLGWVVSGPLNIDCFHITQCHFTHFDLQDQLSRFWELEHYPAEKVFSEEESFCETHYVANTKRSRDGQFIVSIPFKEHPMVLGDSLQLATKRFLSLERRLLVNKDLRDLYVAFMYEYEKLGHMSPAGPAPTQVSYYLPHHGVLKEESLTTKLRVVFNGSANSSSGQSLNSIQMVGPTIQQDLFSILVRFRKYVYAISSDIKKMYRQVQIDPAQRSLQCILWRATSAKPIQTYELNTVTYGTASASFLAIRSLIQLGIECEGSLPGISKVIKEDFYVDDLLTGADTLPEAQNICQELPKVLSTGCFKLHKWISNDPRVLSGVPESDIHPSVLQFEGHEHTKTLGLIWSFQTDELMYSISESSSERLTKRLILSEISQIFDPLGLLTPCIITAKIILQQLWIEKLSWDDAVPSAIQRVWCEYRNNLVLLNDLKVPRHVLCSPPYTAELHGFSDASVSAYGACIYLRATDKDGQVHVHLLCAKSKVAPLKPLTIPRLELCGAALLAKLYSQVVKALNITVERSLFWSDSTIVLGWLKTNPNLLTPFACNRVADIQALTANSSWRHVPTKANPADLASRGIPPSQLKASSLWWHGPQWLHEEESSWPDTDLGSHDLPELKRQTRCLHQSDQNHNLLFSRFSDLTRLERFVAYCLRFKHNCLRSAPERRSGPISLYELQDSQLLLIRLSQAQCFPEELKYLRQNKTVKSPSNIASLNPFVDENGIIRVGGRLQNSLFSFSKKHPALISGNHQLARLIMSREHLRLLHAGPQLLLATTRDRFWITSGRNIAKQTVHRCYRCFRFSPKLTNPIMGNLPASRIQPAPPFATTGVDYAGPFVIKDRKGRGCKTMKAYICLFICFATKALHLELVTDLSTERFILSLRRFVSRRGRPSKIYSDNGATFVGAKSELRELGKFLAEQSATVSAAATLEGIEWHFIPAYSPHFGGIWEAGVKSCKYHIKRVIGNALLTYEELSTLLIQIEAILNSRPLSPLSSDPNDLQPLTPSHFLIGRPLTAIPDPDLTDIPGPRLSTYQRIQQLQQHLWSRWSKEYVSELQQRTKWRFNHSELQENTLVLIKQDNVSPLRWNIGRVMSLHPGKDGISRVASVRTATGVIRRSFSKICPLPMCQ